MTLQWTPAGQHAWGDCLMGESETIKCTIAIERENASLWIMMRDHDMLHTLQHVTFTPTQIKAGRTTLFRTRPDGRPPEENVLEAAKNWAESFERRIVV